MMISHVRIAMLAPPGTYGKKVRESLTHGFAQRHHDHNRDAGSKSPIDAISPFRVFISDTAVNARRDSC